MKILLLTTLVVLAAADVSHLLNQQNSESYQYQDPQNSTQSSYGVPQASVLGDLGGSVQNSVGSASVPELTLPSGSGPTLKFNSGSPDLSGATIQTFENGVLSTPVPLTADVFASLQASTPAPSVDLSSFQVSSPSSVDSISSVDLAKYQQPSSSYQFLSKFSQPSVSTAGINSAQYNSDAFLNSRFGQNSFGSDGQLNAGFGLGGSIVGSSVGSLDEAQLNLGVGLGGSQFNSKTIGGNINDAFGVSVGSRENGIIVEPPPFIGGPSQPEVSKHLYLFEASHDEEEDAEPKIIVPPVAPKKTYKIIFIKAPAYRNRATITVPAPPQNEEKTLVYVLVKKPQSNTKVRFTPAEPTKPSKPEVFFVKYKTQKEAEDAVAEIQSKHGASGQVISNLPVGQSPDYIPIPTNLGPSVDGHHFENIIESRIDNEPSNGYGPPSTIPFFKKYGLPSA